MTKIAPSAEQTVVCCHTQAVGSLTRVVREKSISFHHLHAWDAARHTTNPASTTPLSRMRSPLRQILRFFSCIPFHSYLTYCVHFCPTGCAVRARPNNRSPTMSEPDVSQPNDRPP